MTTNANIPAGQAGDSPSARTALSGPPPVRWGGIILGLLLVAFATLTLIVVWWPGGLAQATVWIGSLTPGATWALWIALLGLVIVVSALLGAIRAAQQRRRRPSR